ncbi:MAG: phosphoglycerate kinase [Alphaproteobacteria bacterium]|nr:phosphoglycerate kinase [Alphaproteobacteria bacterium]
MNVFMTLDDLSSKGKIVLLRVDLNVPMQNGQVSDMTRITRVLPTIRELTAKGGKVVLLSHFGRPEGKDTSLSLEPVGKAVEHALGKTVVFVNDCIGDAPASAIAKMKEGDVLLLENTRFYAEEEKNDKAFSAKIAALGNVYVNDAFSTAHRAHATTHGIAGILPAYAGRLMEAELKALSNALDHPARPVIAIVGGAKISTKLNLLNNLVKKIDTLVLGGGMANTFLHALGTPMGKSLCERDMATQALEIIETAHVGNCKIILPVDGVVAKELKTGTDVETVGIDSIPQDAMMLDIGKGSVAVITDELCKAKTLLWNGPLGAFETPPFDSGTTALAKIAAELTAQGKLVSIAGGGDTVSALANACVDKKMTYVSTAGGAFLEWLEGKDLPGVRALMDSALDS